MTHDMYKPTEFKTWLEEWLASSGMSQNALAMSVPLDDGRTLGQGVISRWLHPDARQRTQPDPKTLLALAPVVRVPYADLMVIAGHWPDPKATRVVTASEPDNTSPELAALLAHITKSYHALSHKPGERGIIADVTRNIWHRPLRQSGRPRNQYPKPQGNDGQLDNPNGDSVGHILVAIS